MNTDLTPHQLAQVLEEVRECVSADPNAFKYRLVERMAELRASAAGAGKGELASELIDEVQNATNASRIDCIRALGQSDKRVSVAIDILRHKGNATSAQPAADRSQDARDEEAFWIWWRSDAADDLRSGIWSTVEKACMAWMAALRHARSTAPVREENAVSLQEALARIRKWQEWADYACKRFTEETGKDLQAAAGS